MSHIPAAIIL